MQLFTDLITDGTAVQGAVVTTLNAAAGSPFVRRLLATEASAPLVEAILAIAADKKAGLQLRLEAVLTYSLLPAEETFRKRYAAVFGTMISPVMLALLAESPQLADGALLTLTNFAAEGTFRREMAASDTISELFTYAKRWATDVMTSGDSAATKKVKADALYTMLGLVQNLGLDSAGCAYIQQPAVLQSAVELLGVKLGNVYARAALIVSRVTTTKQVAERLVSMGCIQTMVGLIDSPLRPITSDSELENLEFANAAAMTAVKVMQLLPSAKSVVANEAGIKVWLKLLSDKDPKVLGNAALCISECCKDAKVCMDLASTTVVADLLKLARKEKSKLTENCAIALARYVFNEIPPVFNEISSFNQLLPCTRYIRHSFPIYHARRAGGWVLTVSS